MDNKRPLLWQLVRWVVIALLVGCFFLLLLWLARLVFTWVVLPVYVERHVTELARVTGWSGETTGIFGIGAVFIICYVAEFVFRRNQRQRWAALAVLGALAGIYLGLHAWFSRGHLYGPEGRPLFYWGLSPSGDIHKQFRPGINPYTGRPLVPASPEYLALVRSRLHEPMREVDPASTDWFDPNTGWPLLWFARNPGGSLEFFRRPAFHPRYRVEIQPVTVEIRHEWDSSQARQLAESKAREARETEVRLKHEAGEAAERKRRADLDREMMENARHQREAAAALAQAAAKRQTTEQEAREAAAKAERQRHEKEAEDTLKRQAVLNRIARESTAKVEDLDWLVPAVILTSVCPGLTSASFRPEVFEQDFAGRRFRLSGRVARLSGGTNQAAFAPLTIGSLHLVVQATFQPDCFGRLVPKHDATIAGTVAAIHFASGTTNMNGILGQVCILEIGNASLIQPELAATRKKTNAPTTVAIVQTNAGPAAHTQPITVPPVAVRQPGADPVPQAANPSTGGGLSVYPVSPPVTYTPPVYPVAPLVNAVPPPVYIAAPPVYPSEPRAYAVPPPPAVIWQPVPSRTQWTLRLGNLHLFSFTPPQASARWRPYVTTPLPSGAAPWGQTRQPQQYNVQTYRPPQRTGGRR